MVPDREVNLVGLRVETTCVERMMITLTSYHGQGQAVNKDFIVSPNKFHSNEDFDGDQILVFPLSCSCIEKDDFFLPLFPKSFFVPQLLFYSDFSCICR